MTLQHDVKSIDLKAAVAGFAGDMKAFRADLDEKMTTQARRLDAMERKALSAARPALARAAEERTPQQKALSAYLRRGDESGLRLEEKALSGATPSEGGALLDPMTAGRVESLLRGAGSLRALATVAQVTATAYDALVDVSELGAGWLAESGSVAETDSPQIERVSIPLHEVYAAPQASQRLLDDAAFDVEAWLSERIAERFGRVESAAFISGDGADKPRGVLDHTQVANASWAWGSLGYVATGAAGAFAAADPGDALIDLVYALPAGYRAGASFVMNSRTAGAVRKLKDVDGRYLWSEGVAEGQPARLMGYPVVIVEDMPDIAADAAAIAFGDFRRGYTIAERPETRVLRDPYSAKPHVLFYATRRVGGDVTDFAAIKLLKFAAS